jgi:hypothetical protein
MKKSLLFLLLLASLTVFSQSKNQAVEHTSTIQLFDSIYYWTWDDFSLSFENNFREIDLVYEDNNLVSELKQKWNDNDWENQYLFSLAYDDRHNETYKLQQRWIIDSWVNLYEYTHTYDVNNNLTGRKSLMWYETYWANSWLYNFEYDAHNNLISESQQIGDDTEWTPHSQVNYTFDENNNLKVTESYNSWNGSYWDDGSKSIFTYDALHHLINNILQDWNGSEWINVAQYTWTYDNENNWTTELLLTWNGSIWEEVFLNTFTYDNNSNLIIKLKQTPDGNSWHNNYLVLYTYDPGANLTNELGKMWKSSLNDWSNDYQDVYTYDSENNKTSWLELDWDGSDWIQGWNYVYTYDVNNNQTSLLRQLWNGTEMVHSHLDLKEFDENNFVICESGKSWEEDGISISGADTTHYYFKTVLGMEEFPSDLTCIKLFPNPGKDFITIAIPENVQLKYSKLEIFDLKGQNIYIQSITDNLTKVNVGHFAPGLYAVKINCGGKISTMKFLKE